MTTLVTAAKETRGSRAQGCVLSDHGLLSTLICHENGAFQKRCSKQEIQKRQLFGTETENNPQERPPGGGMQLASRNP